MKKCRLLLISILLFALFGCVKENTTAVFPEPEKQQVQQTRLSLDEAQSEVENLLAQIDQTTRTNGVQRKVVDYYCIGKKSITRSNTLPEGDELLTYVFNFDNNNGYAIVAGDTRIISPVLALTDDGYLNPEEGVENPGLINFLALAEHYYETEIQRYEEANGKMQTPQTRIDINYTQWEWYGEWEVKQLLGRRTYLNWTQGSPFNNNIAKISGQTPPLGCTATATMLLMAWYQYPQIYEGHRYNWAEMLKHKNEQTNNNQANSAAYADLARLAEVITRPENLDMTFGLDGSGAWEDNIPRTLQRLGYFYGGTFCDWNIKIALNELREYPYYPVVVSAYAFKTETRSEPVLPDQILGVTINAPTGISYSSGHTFLVESAMIRERAIRFVYTGELSSKTETLVYVNYGWSGSSNGYYNAGVFNAAVGPVTRTTTGKTDNYKYDIDMVYGVRI